MGRLKYSRVTALQYSTIKMNYMRYIALLALVLTTASCKKESTYKATCDIYGIKSQTYNPNSPLSDAEVYTNSTRDEAEEAMALFQIKYTDARKDTFQKIKTAYPEAFISCGLSDTNE